MSSTSILTLNKQNKMSVRESGFLNLPLLSQLDLLAKLEDREFKYVCTLTPRLQDICNDTVPSSQRLSYNNPTDSLYRERSKYFFEPDIFALKWQVDMPWKEFYERVTKALTEFSRERRSLYRNDDRDAQRYIQNEEFPP